MKALHVIAATKMKFQIHQIGWKGIRMYPVLSEWILVLFSIQGLFAKSVEWLLCSLPIFFLEATEIELKFSLYNVVSSRCLATASKCYFWSGALFKT